MRLALVVAAIALSGCVDVHELQGDWSGQRIGEVPALRVGFEASASAALELDSVEQGAIAGRLTISGVIDDAQLEPIPGAQADALASLSHGGNPLAVHLAFVETSDGGGPATVFISVYDSDRIEVRVLRGGAQPLYGVFRLRR